MTEREKRRKAERILEQMKRQEEAAQHRRFEAQNRDYERRMGFEHGVLERWGQGGITADDLDRACTKSFREGFEKGYNLAVTGSLKKMYACAVMALREEFGFGRERSIRFLERVDDKVNLSFDAEDECRKVWDELGIELDFKEAFGRIYRKSENGSVNDSDIDGQ